MRSEEINRQRRRAEGTTVLTVFLVAGPGAATTLPWMVGEDHDRFMRTEHGWRLVLRRDVGSSCSREVMS